MPSGMDSGRITDLLNLSVGYETALAVSWTGTTGHVVLLTALGANSSANGTVLAAGGSYAGGTAGIAYTAGAAGAFTTATYSTGTGTGTVQNGSVISQSNMPATTVVGCEIWDNAGTQKRWWWGSLSSSVTTNAGDTLSFAAAAIAGQLQG